MLKVVLLFPGFFIHAFACHSWCNCWNRLISVAILVLMLSWSCLYPIAIHFIDKVDAVGGWCSTVYVTYIKPAAAKWGNMWTNKGKKTLKTINDDNWVCFRMLFFLAKGSTSPAITTAALHLLNISGFLFIIPFVDERLLLHLLFFVYFFSLWVCFLFRSFDALAIKWLS